VVIYKDWLGDRILRWGTAACWAGVGVIGSAFLLSNTSPPLTHSPAHLVLPPSTEDNNEAGTAEGAAPVNPNNRRVYVGNLSWSTAWQGLKDHMKTVGEGEEMGREGKGREGKGREEKAWKEEVDRGKDKEMRREGKGVGGEIGVGIEGRVSS